MNHYKEAALKSLEARGLPYYQGLKEQYPQHWSSFENMHHRIDACGFATDFPRTYQGFKDFIEYLGPVPVGMIKPSTGRKDHSKGYVRGNFAWQSHFDNTSEAYHRRSAEISIYLNSGKTKQLRRSLLKFIENLLPGQYLIDKAFLALTGYSRRNNLYCALNDLGNLKVDGRKFYLVK